LGEAQAGIVYRTDARAAQGKVSVVDIPSNLNVIAQYPIAMTSGASHPKLASDWIEFVIGPEGQAALQKAAFLPPLVQTASNTAEARASAGAGSSSQP
jgi:molybdate transport system substrate-binding protein